MKNFILIIAIFIFSCSTSNKKNDISLIGNIDKKANCEINLSKKGNIVKGNLLNIDNKEKIDLKGTIVNNHLRIEEYAKENELTGIFDGNYKDGIYKGFWKSPNNKISVPFIFYSKNSSKKLITNEKSNILKSEYLKWVVQMNNSDGYCTNEECENSEGLNSNCSSTIMKEFPTEIIYGDINNDGIEDAFIYAIEEPCMMGTWFINVAIAGHLVIFISNTDNTYKIINEPEILRENIKFGRIKRIEGNIIYAEGLGLDIENGGIHHLGYKWNCKFEFKNEIFYLISKSTQEKYDGK